MQTMENGPDSSDIGPTDAAPAGATPDEKSKGAISARPRRRRANHRACWLYCAVLLALWGVLFFGADRAWLPTVVMFGPRWVWGVPLPALTMIAVLRRARVVTPLLLASLVLVGPIARFCLPWRTVLSPGPTPAQNNSLRVMTCNTDVADLNPGAMRTLLDETRPDVVVLQAWSNRYERDLFGRVRGPGGWYVRRDGELFLASRHPVLATRLMEDPAFTTHAGTLARYELDTPAGRVWLFNIHLATPREGLLSVIRLEAGAPSAVRHNILARRDQSRLAKAWIDSSPGTAIVAGDFNTPTDSAIYREFWSGYENAFSTAGFGLGRTHLTRRTSVRIDHVLAGPGWKVSRCRLGPDVGSAHRPVIADLVLTQPPPH